MIEGKKKVIFLSLCILPLGLDFCRSVCSTKLGHFWKRWICWVRNQRGLGACEMSRFCLKISSNSIYRTPTHFVSLLGLKTIWDNFAMLSVQTYRQISWPVFPSDGRRGRFSRAQSRRVVHGNGGAHRHMSRKEGPVVQLHLPAAFPEGANRLTSHKVVSLSAIQHSVNLPPWGPPPNQTI